MRAVLNSKQLLVAISAAVLAAVVIPVAMAGAAGGAKAAPVAKTVKQLKKQVKTLQGQIAALQGQVDNPRPPSGPAGGDLTGTFPNPLIGPNTIGAAEIQKDAVGAEEIQANAVGSGELAANAVEGADIKDEAVQAEDIGANSVGTADIADGQVSSTDLGEASVGEREMKKVTAVIGAGVGVSAGVAQTTSVTCPQGTFLLAGGYAWTDKEANSIIANAPSQAQPRTTWVVEGMVDAGSNNLYAWANCLAE